MAWISLSIEIASLIVALLVFILTSRSEKKATEEQTHRECVRATLRDFAELRRSNSGFPQNLHSAAPDERGGIIKTYLADLERFAVGCNMNAYSLEVVSKMSGGMLLNHYKKYFKPYIEGRRRALALSSRIEGKALYGEVEAMIAQLCRLRGEPFEPVEMLPEAQQTLERFLDFPISASTAVFALFRSLPGAVEDHGEGKQGYLYVPGTRKDRCLLVAHADTVFDACYVEETQTNRAVLEDGVYRGENPAASIGADDRCGCAMLWLLRGSGHSLLLLDGEEKGAIGANYLKDSNPDLFRALNEHCFILELDRRGNSDYRTYDLPVTEEFKAFIERETKYRLAEGSGRTDICVLCDAICGANLSVGYYDEHRPAERVVLAEWQHTLSVVEKMLARPLKQYRLV